MRYERNSIVLTTNKLRTAVRNLFNADSIFTLRGGSKQTS
jgi:hypothetical protein